MPEVARLPPSTPADIRIGDALASDLDDLAAIELAAFRTDRLSRRQFAAHVRGGRADVLVARHGSGLAGYALVFRRRDSAVARLYSLAVAESWTGRGLGVALLHQAEQRATAAGAKFLRLEVRADNGPAIRLYEDQGYRFIGRRDTYYEDGAPALRYERLLLNPRDESGPRALRLGQAA
jgi:ribosomal protein S18 acetylase RimI-like enzyme